MKKTFKKLLALFLTGTMLAGVGCKDYDDDIDNLQKEIDDLKGPDRVESRCFGA